MSVVEVVRGCRRGGAGRSGGPAAGGRRSLAGAGEVVGEVGERGVEEAEQRAEGVLVAAVRRRGDQDQVPVSVGGEARDELVALVAAAPALARTQAQVWASSTITSSGQARRNSSRRRSDLMKSVETMT